MPPLMSNHGNYIVSLRQLVRWLADQAAELGVDIYPGFAGCEVLYDESGAAVGVATGDMGISRDGKPKDSFVRGMELKGKYTLIAEGARGSLAKQLIARFKLGEGREPRKFGIGLKELWEIAQSNANSRSPSYNGHGEARSPGRGDKDCVSRCHYGHAPRSWRAHRHGRRPRFAEVAQYCVTIPRGVSRCRTQPMSETFTILAFSLTIRAVP